MDGDEVEVGGLGDEGWLQSDKVMPYVEENGKHFGGLSWSSGTDGNCLRVEISLPMSRSGKAPSTVLRV
jgi:hypothetical protein